MRIKILLLVFVILMASCVKQSKYEELQYKYDSLVNKYEECQQERNECRQLYLEKYEEVEELEETIAYMQDAMREAVRNYDFWGPGHFFTQSSVHALKSYY